jgi:hypothetical protein
MTADNPREPDTPNDAPNDAPNEARNDAPNHAQEAVQEAVVSPWRQRDRGGRLIPPPEWWDLPPEALDALYRRQLQARALERALDPQGRSGTVRAVMARVRGLDG